MLRLPADQCCAVTPQDATVRFAAGLPAGFHPTGGPPSIPSSISCVVCRVVEITAYLTATIFSHQIIKCLNYSEAGRGVWLCLEINPSVLVCELLLHNNKSYLLVENEGREEESGQRVHLDTTWT